MPNEIVKGNTSLSEIEQLIVMGDLAKLQPSQRLEYYRTVCESVGLNPYTRPFEYITLNGKLTLYARKDATDQLRKLNGVSIVAIERDIVNDVFVVMARAMTQDGRSDEDTGAVSVKGLQGEALANAMMKAITKAKRRVTLSICGLGWLDETEVDTIPSAQRIVVAETGEIVTPVTQPQNGGAKPAVAAESINRDERHDAGSNGSSTTNGTKPNGSTDVYKRYAAAKDAARASGKFSAEKHLENAWKGMFTQYQAHNSDNAETFLAAWAEYVKNHAPVDSVIAELDAITIDAVPELAS